MNKGCHYTAQGKFFCNVEKAPARKEPFVEHFAAAVNIQAAKLNTSPPGPDSSFGNFAKACRMKPLPGTNIQGCNVNCGEPPSTSEDITKACSISCLCAIKKKDENGKEIDVNTNDDPKNNYCATKGNCRPARLGSREKGDFKIRFDKGNYAPVKKIVSYNGQLYTEEMAEMAKKQYEVAMRRQTAGERKTGGEMRPRPRPS